MISQEHIKKFSVTLKTILNREIEHGNIISETSEGWHDQNMIIILLEKPFLDEYKIEGVDYRNIDDPHYWKAEYFDSSTSHILACKF